eukprot:Skav219715  [mRNA]  locus=scaffold301:27192:31400:+ [translate_table: standard]
MAGALIDASDYFRCQVSALRGAVARGWEQPLKVPPLTQQVHWISEHFSASASCLGRKRGRGAAKLGDLWTQVMFLGRPHYIALWVSGFITGAVWPYSQGPSTADLQILTSELRVTRVAIEESIDHSCKAELHTEIRYSAGLRVALQGLTVLQVLLYLWVCLRPCCRSQRVQARPVEPNPVSSSSESEVSTSVPVVERKGPVRPSDLRKLHGGPK